MKHIIIAVILIISNVFLGIAKPMKSQAEIYFAGGCFWGTEHFLKQIRGVESTQVGYANSTVANPSYEQVCSGKTNAAETVKVVYDPEEVNLSLLLNLYFQTIDPTSLNRQGNDRGTQSNLALQLDNTKKVLYKEIQQAWYNAVAAESKYNSSEVAVKANEESFRLMSEKFNNGKATFVEYNEAKLNLTKALSDKLQAKYDYLFRTKILDFYKGEIIE